MNTEIIIRIEDVEQPAKSIPDLSFVFDENTIRIQVDQNQKVWFCASDICSVLEYRDTSQAIRKNCKSKGTSSRRTLTKGGYQSLTYIDEGNLYRLIVKSRKPQAEPFEEWVFDEVLPTIRKTGKYELPPVQPETITDEQYAQLFQAIQKTIEGAISANVRPKLVNYLKCQFNADPLTNLRFDDLQPALSFLKSTKEQLSDIRSLLRELEEIAVKDVIAGSMPSLRHLKGRYRRELEKKTGKPVSAHELLVHDYIEQNGLALVEA